MNVSVRGLWNVEFHNSSRKNNPSDGKNIKNKLDAWCFWANQGPKNIATHEKHDITESHFSICWGAKSERPSWVEQNTKCTMHHCRMQMRKSCYRRSDQMGNDQEVVQRTEGTRSQASRGYTKVSWQALCRIRCFLLRSLHTLSLKKLSWQDLHRSLCNVSVQVLYKRSPGKILQGCLKKASQKRAGLEWYQNRWTDQCWSTLLVLMYHNIWPIAAIASNFSATSHFSAWFESVTSDSFLNRNHRNPSSSLQWPASQSRISTYKDFHSELIPPSRGMAKPHRSRIVWTINTSGIFHWFSR